MKKHIKRIFILTFAAMFLFTSCESFAHLRELEDGRLFYKTKNVYYVPCSIDIKAFALGGLFGKTDNKDFYEIQFEDPSEFISESDSTFGGVYMLSTLPEITLENFGAVSAIVYISGEIDVAITQFMVAPEYLPESYNESNYSDGSAYTNAVADAIINGENVGMPINIDENETLQIRLLSADYQGLSYTVLFIMDVNGNCYLYDRADQKCVVCPDIVKSRLKNDNTSETSSQPGTESGK